MSIDRKSPIPVYYQLKEDFKKKINDGIWKVGQCIDSERELTEEYDVSRMTIRQALGELVKEGILVREKGKGTYVCEPKIRQVDIMSFSEIAHKAGLSLKTQVLNFEKVKASDEIYEELQVEDIYVIERARIINNEIIAVEAVYVACEFCGEVTKEDLEGSLYKILRSKGQNVDHCEAKIQAVLLSDYHKELFKIEGNVPLLKSFSKNFTIDDKLLFIEESIYRSDKYVLEVNIMSKEGKIK